MTTIYTKVSKPTTSYQIGTSPSLSRYGSAIYGLSTYGSTAYTKVLKSVILFPYTWSYFSNKTWAQLSTMSWSSYTTVQNFTWSWAQLSNYTWGSLGKSTWGTPDTSGNYIKITKPS